MPCGQQLDQALDVAALVADAEDGRRPARDLLDRRRSCVVVRVMAGRSHGCRGQVVRPGRLPAE